MGMESMGLDLEEQSKLNVTLPGQPGYQGAWDASVSNKEGQASPEMLRDAAIESADVRELEDAVTRMEQKENRDAETLAALAKVRARLDELIQRSQH